ncbi:hypothetical protein OA501_03020 [Flavobacteriaceae bacterium]|nr:hypothetical protein [Flavobacteriaceae bacterium]
MRKQSAFFWILSFFLFGSFFSCQKASSETPLIEEELFPSLGHDAPYNTTTTYFGRNRYVEYYPGDLPIVFSAPHGGAELPAEIPNRTYGTLVNDANTKELTKAIMYALQTAYGSRPHVIINNLDRKKMDANRDLTEAAQGNIYAERAWEEFQFYIETAKNKVIQDFEYGLFIDLHGHGVNPDGFYDLRIWLGYLLTAEELNKSDDQLDTMSYQNKSSIRTLARVSPESFVEVLRGSNSMGDLLEASGYGSLPSSQSPSPNGMRYFSGGFNTLKHGSSTDAGRISAIQFELPSPGVRELASDRTAFANALTSILASYFEIHYGMTLDQN